jgi:hypothetical protein
VATASVLTAISDRYWQASYQRHDVTSWVAMLAAWVAMRSQEVLLYLTVKMAANIEADSD